MNYNPNERRFSDDDPFAPRDSKELDTLKSLEIKKSYPDDFNKAEKKLNEAEGKLKKGQRDKAYTDAVECLDSFKEILKNFIVGPFRKEAQGLKGEIEKKGKDSSLRDLLPKLDAILKYADEVETGQRRVSLSEVIQKKKETDGITDNVKTNVGKKLASDVSFGIGKYKMAHLSNEGKGILEKFIRDVIAAKDAYAEKVPGYQVTIKIKTSGYTDELPFAEGTNLVRELENGMKPVPRTPPESRRKALNENLSKFRAETIAMYIEQRIRELDNNSSGIKITPETIGKGEEMPEGLESPFPADDPRRRICIIDTHSTIE